MIAVEYHGIEFEPTRPFDRSAVDPDVSEQVSVPVDVHDPAKPLQGVTDIDLVHAPSENHRRSQCGVSGSARVI